MRLRSHSKKDMLEKRGGRNTENVLRKTNLLHVWLAAGYQSQTLVDKADVAEKIISVPPLVGR